MHPNTPSMQLFGIATFATLAIASVQPYGQCGGSNWTGDTTCTPGWTCQYQNPYYSQCLPAPTTTSTTLTTTTTTRGSSGSSPTYKASITWYGQGDPRNSPNCQTDTAACGFYTSPGYSAAISENFYGADNGVGPACGTCWRVTGQTDSSGNQLSNAGTTIVVKINNLCPANSNSLCAQQGKSGTNKYGANVNFDLCGDSGARQAFFGNDGVGLAVGTAVQVDCSQWSGTVVY